jgi:kinesin family protein 2/24
MIANISPSSGSVEHTLNTLRYAYRVKELKGSFVPKRQLPDTATVDTESTVAAPVRVSKTTPVRRPERSTPIARRTPSQVPIATNESSSENEDKMEELSSSVTSSSDEIAIKGGPSALRPTRLPPVVNLTELAKQHDKLIGQILAEEEDLISTHRKSLEAFGEMINREISEVNRIDQPGSDVDVYVEFLDENLKVKELILGELRTKLDRFRNHLEEEEPVAWSLIGIKEDEVLCIVRCCLPQAVGI